MESKINYTLVGLFVVTLLTGLLSLVYWLEQYGDNQAFDSYHVYITESIAGLSPDASVKYRGVEVGTVDKIDINKENSEEVVLLLKIKHGTPIKSDAKAALKFFGITGLAYIELSGSSKNAPRLKAQQGEIPVIPAIPSTFAELDDSLRTFSFKSTRALDKFDRLLNEKNLNNIEAVLDEIRQLGQGLNAQQADFHQLLINGITMEKSMTQAMNKVATASDSVDKMASSLEKNYTHVGDNLNQNVKQSLASFNQLVLQLKRLTSQVQSTVQRIDASPGDLLFKHSEIKPGPGEQGYEEQGYDEK